MRRAPEFLLPSGSRPSGKGEGILGEHSPTTDRCRARPLHARRVFRTRAYSGRRVEGTRMTAIETERCPGCRDELPKLVGPTHRYIGDWPACWEIFSNLLNELRGWNVEGCGERVQMQRGGGGS